ncbi:cation diffusion facilitator family transporter [Tardiphaga sp. 37S4]|jgi:cation diffusion facilitator family transporter|uniref:cation diffusion facilitator family transporter n=1 Tax=unclassified Tardiphaga TaxID=2631404 RepID=UPI000B6C000E|nr:MULTISPECIES: cation diffusion facilitator family transporter [unclassified Tardiphaga]UFS75807.1 cation diffusion facilitator family transporter [Tardiphaga sp. 37S4]SNT62180.1 cation diffusion facilitator family transporter [Tardiphaga sp. OK246]
MTSVRSLAQGSIAVGLLVLGMKYAAYHLTGSVALLSDAIESIVNVVTAIVVLLATTLSAKPADDDHPYGHHKAEYFSAVLEGVLIVLAAILILREAYQSYLTPRLVEAPWLGLLVNAAASIINAGWAWVLIRQGRIHRSPALAADGRHLLSDVYSSIGVLGGVGVAALSGIAILDPILAALVALNILWAGWGLMKESLSGLMDEAIPPAMLASIKQTISAHADGAIEAHDLRTRRAGSMTFIDFHLVVAGSTTVSAAHDICDKLETAIRQEIGEALITIHVEPDDKAKHSGIVVL